MANPKDLAAVAGNSWFKSPVTVNNTDMRSSSDSPLTSRIFFKSSTTAEEIASLEFSGTEMAPLIARTCIWQFYAFANLDEWTFNGKSTESFIVKASFVLSIYR